MKAIAVTPGERHTARVMNIPRPELDQVPGGKGVLVKILRVGLDGTDREIDEGEYGAAPPGSDFLVLGHESVGVVEEVGEKVTGLVPGDLVVAMVRHPGGSLYDLIGRPDLTTDAEYHEHGISLMHGFLTEYYVDRPEFLVKIPPALREVAVLLEPFSVAAKGINQAFEIQRRLKVWQPARAAVLGAGPLGLLAALVLRLRGLEVTTFARERPPSLKVTLVEQIGARYQSVREQTLTGHVAEHGPFDLIFEATGYSPLVFEAMLALSINGVLITSGVTGGERMAEVEADKIVLAFVLGNRAMAGTVNASREDFESALRDMALCEAQYPGWLERFFTRRVPGLESCPMEFKLMDLMQPGTLKTTVEVATL